MALTDQPYLPLYVDDFMNNNKLKLCSLQSKGLIIQIMCIMHKEADYGVICLKQKFKQTEDKIKNFAMQIAKLANLGVDEVTSSLEELLIEECLKIDGDNLICPRMVKDAQISLIRSKTGKTGGSNVTKQYGRKGTLYLISDSYFKHKIGISINPKNRLYRLRSDLKLPMLEIIDKIIVRDMGKAEDEALSFFSDIRDGEWLNSDFNTVTSRFALLKANYGNGIDNENETKSENETIAYPFDSEAFMTMWANWKEYKKREWKFHYKSPQSQQSTLTELANLAGGSEVMAIEIIKHAMAKGWKGFYAINNNSNNGNRSQQQRATGSGVNTSDAFEYINSLYGSQQGGPGGDQ